MPSARDIRSKIGSVKNTQKITRAMEMVAASKMRKAQEQMRLSRPYAEKIRSVVGHVAEGHVEYQHPFLEVREVKRVGYIIVSSDRGLCGGLNNNLFKKTIKALKQHHENNVDIDLCLIGRKAENFFRRVGGNVVAEKDHIGDSPSVVDLIGVVKVMLDAYIDGKIDELHICYNRFVNTMTQEPRVQQLLPLQKFAEDEESSEDLSHHWDYIYEPGAKELISAVLTRYIESQVYQAVVENIASFQAAQMIAMKNATENAGELIDELNLAYNKARQAAITRELAEIVSGADAVA